MSWVGIPIVMFVNNPHAYMNEHAFSTIGVNNQEKLLELRAKAMDRDAIM